jgi:hypothetical protein
VGGFFTYVGDGIHASSVAAWDGARWSALGGGIGSPPYPYVFAIQPDATGFVAAGLFDHAGGHFARNTARWDGTGWHTFGSGMSSGAYALAVYDGSIYFGGEFSYAGGKASHHVARWIAPPVHVPRRFAADRSAVRSPGPYRAGQPIRLSHVGNAELEVGIFGVDGRRIRAFVARPLGGTLQATWDGRRDDGSRASPGVYFVVTRNGSDPPAGIRLILLR